MAGDKKGGIRVSIGVGTYCCSNMQIEKRTKN